MNITLESVIEALQKSWADDTCYEETEWSEKNPARGQCVVSSLVMQDYFGGELIRYKVSGDRIDETHYCNIFDNGTLIDVTASQYTQPVTFVVAPVDLKNYVTIREKRLADKCTRHRYELLLSRVKTYLDVTS